MKKVFRFLAICSVLILGSSCIAAELPSNNDHPHVIFIDTANLSKLRLPKKMPEGYPGLSNCVYYKGGVIEESKDVEETILKREQAYSFHWMFGALSNRLWCCMGQFMLESIPRERILPSRRFNGKDDVMFIHYQTMIYDTGRYDDVQVVDWRDLSILVTSPCIRTSSIEEIVKRCLSADYLFTQTTRKFTTISQDDLGEGRSCGKIQFWHEKDESFPNPLEWYKDGGCVLFVFVKERIPQFLRNGEDPAPNWYGGMAYNDSRPLLRFENSNRIEVAEEYAKAKREKKSKK